MAAPLVFLVVGEPSGDALGAGLMRSLRRLEPGVGFAGVGGPEMEAEGLHSLFPMSDLAVMGVMEVLPRIVTIARRLRQTVAAVRELRPDAVVTVDAQGFSYRVARRLHPAPCPVIHYVAPTVWAWKPWRAARVAAVVDRLLLLFPFETPHWDAVGQDTVYVGHTIADQTIDPDARRRWRRWALGDRPGPLLCLLPGSRTSEIGRHLALFGEVAHRLATGRPGLSVAIPTLEHTADMVSGATAGWTLPVRVAAGGSGSRRAAMAASDAAMAVSGTVALDLASAGTPHVIAYRANPVTAAIVRRMITVRYASLVNLIAGREVNPEFIQRDCVAEKLQAAMVPLLDDPRAADTQRAIMKTALSALRVGPDGSSMLAARSILECVERRRPRAVGE